MPHRPYRPPRTLRTLNDPAEWKHSLADELPRRSRRAGRNPSHRKPRPMHPDQKGARHQQPTDVRRGLKDWITACNLKFAGQPSRFPDERQKLVFATSYLKGPPLSWINPALNKYLVPGPLDEVPAELTSFKAFTETLKTLYGGPKP